MMLKVCWLTSFSSISKALGTRNHDDDKSPFEKGRDKIHPSKRAVMTTIALRKEPGGAEDNDDEGLLVDVVLLDLEGPGNSQPPLEGEVDCGRTERSGSTPAASGTRLQAPHA